MIKVDVIDARLPSESPTPFRSATSTSHTPWPGPWPDRCVPALAVPGPDARKGDLSPADYRMLELLTPFPGHRGRVCLLLQLAGHRAPRFGPRQTVSAFARY